MNPLDRAIALNRRGHSEPQASFYSGATANRLTEDWLVGSTSADAQVRTGLRVLRNRAREMVANNAHFARFVGLVEENVVGPNGITLQSRVGEQAGALDKSAIWEIERAWREWSEAANASADRRLCREEIEQQIARTVPQDGEVIVRMLPGFKNKHGFAVQLLDADQLDDTMDRPASATENAIRMGVEVDRWGAPVKYHIWSDHPYDYQGGSRNMRRVPVPADEIAHPYLAGRVGQSRGITWFTPVLLDARMHRGYREAELVAARTAAAKMGFFVQKGEGVTPAMDNQGRPVEPEAMNAAAGVIERLPAGWEFQEWALNHPNSAFPSFDKAVLRSIAAGVRSSYNTLSGDLEGVSYSSLRSGELKERDVWKLLQAWMVRSFNQPVFRQWLKWALVSGAVRLPSRDWTQWAEARFRPRGWTWVDPLKDVATAEKELALGLNSRTRICAERGVDFEDVLIDLKREKELMEIYGVELRQDGTKTVLVFDDTERDGQDGENARVLRLAEGA